MSQQLTQQRFEHTLDLETHGLGCKFAFAEGGLSPYWGVVSCYEPDHDETLAAFDALGETWVVADSKHWTGQLAPPDGQDHIDGGMNEYQYQLVADDDAGDRDLTIQFRPGFPDAEHVDTGDTIGGIPDDHPESIRVQCMATNLDVDEVLPLLRSFADQIGLNSSYFEAPHDYSTVYQLERYARLDREVAEASLTGDGGMLDQLADFGSSQSGRGKYLWDHEEVQAHYEAVAMDPDTWGLMIPGQDLGKQLKVYHPKHVRDADSDDPLADPKIEVSLSSEYDPDGTVRWDSIEDAITDLDAAAMNVLSWAGVEVGADPDTWNPADPYFDVETREDPVQLVSNPLPELRDATGTLVEEELMISDISAADKEVLLALTDGGKEYERLADEAGVSTSSVYRLLDKFEALLESDNGIVQWVDEVTREHADEILQPLRDATQWAGSALRQAADREGLIRGSDGESALEQWMKRHGIELVGAGTQLRFKLGRPVSRRKLSKILRAGLDAAAASGYESDFREATIDWLDLDDQPHPGWQAFVGDDPLGVGIHRF